MTAYRRRPSAQSCGTTPTRLHLRASARRGKEQLAIRTRVSPAATAHCVHDLFGNVIAETAGGGATGTTGTAREYIWLPETEIAPMAPRPTPSVAMEFRNPQWRQEGV